MKKIQRVVFDQVPIDKVLVYFEPIWGQRCNPGEHNDCFDHGCMDNEPSFIAEIEGHQTVISEENYLNLPVNVIGKNTDLNNDNCHDDTHDLRAKIFDSLKDAGEHLKYTLNRFNNPLPWESFVKTE